MTSLDVESYAICGTEIEHDVFCRTHKITRDMVIGALVKHAALWGETHGMALIGRAGDLDYGDANYKAEHAGPEVTNGHDAMVYELAGSLRWAIAAYYLDMSLATDRKGPQTWILKTNTSHDGNSSGACHCNILMPIIMDEYAAELHFIAAQLAAFLVSLQIVCGAGLVIPRWRHPNTAIFDDNYGYVIGARGFHVTHLVGTANNSSADGHKPVFQLRKEAHADATRFRRLQICGLDSNILPEPIALKMDLLLLMTEMVARGRLLPIMLDEPESNACTSMRTVSSDWRAKLRIIFGPTGVKQMTALEIQWYYFNQADKYVHSYETPNPKWIAVLERWEQILEGLSAATDLVPDSLFGLVDWVTKAVILAAKKRRLGKPLSYGQAERIQFDYHGWRMRTKPASGNRECTPLRLAKQYGPPGLWHEMIAALNIPPSDTRAFGRGTAVSVGLPGLVAGDWSGLDMPGMGRIHFSDPRVPMTPRLAAAIAMWQRAHKTA